MEAVGMNIHYVRYPLSFFLDEMVKLGVKNVELWLAAPHFSLDDTTGEDALAMKEALDSRGLRCVCITPEQCAYPINYGLDDEAIRSRSIAYFKHAIDVAHTVGAKKVLVTSGYNYFHAPREIGWQLTRDALRELSAYAAPYGIDLMLEALLHTTTKTVNTSSDIVQMIREVGAPNLFGMLDFSQMFGNGETIETFTENLGPLLHYVHLIDGTPTGHLALGDGSNDLNHLLDTVRGSGYDGYVSLEILPNQYFEDPTPPLAQSLTWLRENNYL